MAAGSDGARLGEGGRVEHDRVERVAGGLAIAQIVERVGLDQLDIRDAVARAVLAGALQRVGRDVERDHGVGSPGEVERERAVIAEAIERSSAGALADQHAILALVEERASFLTAPGRGEHADAVLVDLDLLRHCAAQQLDADGQLSFARSATSLRARIPSGCSESRRARRR